MRNLKKILAMVLALVMSLSLVTIANASDFTDSDDITYEEAADVMSTIGVIEGFEDGSFDPDGTLTREQAAKLVTYMLLGTNADRLGIEGSTFKDVATTRWSASAIEYCASLGLIDGAGDGNFYPAGQLTANAFAKILLTAIGYSSEKEQMTGPSWSVNVAALAIDVGLDNGIEDLSWNDVLTREEAAQMALNAICAPLVAYDNDVTIVVGDTPVSFGSGDAYYVTTTLAREQRISTQQLSNTKEYTVEFGERYFPNLRLISESDEFERPSHTWVYENEEIGTYVDYNLLQETYTTGVTGADLYNLIGRTAIADYDLEVYVDGVDRLDDSTYGFGKAALRRNNDNNLTPTGNGVLTQVFVDHDEELVTVTCINTWLAKANSDYNERSETLSLAVYTGYKETSSSPKTYQTVASTKFVEYVDVPAIEGIEKDQYVLVNMSGKDRGDEVADFEVVKVEDVEILSGSTVTRFSQDGSDTDEGFLGSLTADGEKYSGSEKSFYDAEVLNLYADNLLTDMTYNVYLDQYGYAIGVDLHEGDLNYVFITGYDRNKSNISIKTATAAGIFLDGSMEEITVNVTATNKNIEDAADSQFGKWNIGVGGDNGEPNENRWYSYTVNSAGVYTLKPATQSFGTAFDAADVAAEDNIINCSNVRLDESYYGQKKSAYGEDESVFITVETGDVDTLTAKAITKVTGVYTGVQDVEIEVEAVGANTPASSIYTLYDSNYFIIASIVIGDAVGSNANYAYVLDTEADEEYIEDGVYYWEFDAIMDGEEVTLTATGDYTDVFSVLRKNWHHFVELRFNGDYVTEARPIATEDIYGDTLSEIYARISGQDVYDVDLNKSASSELWLQGRTLWVLPDQADRGLTFASDAKAVVIQTEDDETVISEYGSVAEAYSTLADADDDPKALNYEGQIAAVLNSQGVAQWVVFCNDHGLTSNPGINAPTGKLSDAEITKDGNKLKVTWNDDGQYTGKDVEAKFYLVDDGKIYLRETVEGTVKSTVDDSHSLTGSITLAQNGDYYAVITIYDGTKAVASITTDTESLAF